MPILLLVGELDHTTPVKHQQLLFDKLLAKKEFHIIKGAPHTFKEEEHLVEVRDIMSNWIKDLD